MNQILAILCDLHALRIQFLFFVAKLVEDALPRFHAQFVVMPRLNGLLQSKSDQDPDDNHRKMNEELAHRFDRLRRRMDFHNSSDYSNAGSPPQPRALN